MLAARSGALGVGDAMHSRLDDNVPGRECACEESNEIDYSARIKSDITSSELKQLLNAKRAFTAARLGPDLGAVPATDLGLLMACT